MNRILSYFIITMWFVSSCSGGKKLTSSWHDPSVSPKKQTSRFSYQYNEETKLFYKISNDEKNLYVSLLADDPGLKRRLLISGIDLWIDSTARGKMLQGVRLASNAVSAQQRQLPLELPMPPDGSGKVDVFGDILVKNMSLETIGLPYSSVDYEINRDDLNGQHFFFIVPLKFVCKKNQVPAFISLIIESPVPKMKVQQGKNGSGNPGMSRGAGMSGRQGMRSGMGGGRGPGGQKPSGSPDKQKQEIKILIKKLQLATHDKP